jgi:hypothetical protein
MNQSQRDQAETERRVKKCGPLFPVMEERLRAFPKETLLVAATSLCHDRGIAKPDRICARGRASLVCFFCEHFADFPAGFPVLSTAQPAPVPVQKHTHPALSKTSPHTGSTDPDLVGALQPKEGETMALGIFWDGNGDVAHFFRDYE